MTTVQSEWTALASALEAMVGGGGVGPLTSEGLFVLMCEMVEAQNLKLSQKVLAFKANTALQNKYNEFNQWMQAAQSAATAQGGAGLSRGDVESMLRGMGFEGDALTQRVDAIMATDVGGKEGVIEPSELASYVNGAVFGDDNPQQWVQLDGPSLNRDDAYTGGTFLSSHFEQVSAKVDAKQKAMCADTSLMTSEISQLVSEQERLTNMFTNILKKFHDTEMAVIRNI
jgi:hypothetical protein